MVNMRLRDPIWFPLFETGEGNTARISVICLQGQLHGMYKAVVNITNEGRRFGTKRYRLADAVLQVVRSKLPYITIAEQTRLFQMVRDRQGKHASVADLFVDNDVSRRRVGIFHQIDVGPDVCSKTLALVQTSQEEWKCVAEKSGARYYLWTKPALNTIIRGHFSYLLRKLKSYTHREYLDICSMCVLSLCGGMYIDSDIRPNKDVYYQVQFAVSRISKKRRMRMETPQRASGSIGKRCNKSLSTTMKTARPTARNNDYMSYGIGAVITVARHPLIMKLLTHLVGRKYGFPRPSRDQSIYPFTKIQCPMEANPENSMNLLHLFPDATVSFIRCNESKSMTSKEMRSMDVIAPKYKHARHTERVVSRCSLLSDSEMVPEMVLEKMLPIIRLTRRVRSKTSQVHECTNMTIQDALDNANDEIEKDIDIATFITQLRDVFDLDRFFVEDERGKRMFAGLPRNIQEILLSHYNVSSSTQNAQ